MNEYEKNCYSFIKELAEELTKEYEAQYEDMEEFASWNLPEETALEWIDAEEMIMILERGSCISQKALMLLKTILNRFNLEFEKSNSVVWTHEAMQNSIFWKEQRILAREVLEILEKGV